MADSRMGKTRKRKQRGGVDLAKTIEKVQRMDVQIDAMTQKINALKTLLQEPMIPIPESALRAPAPSPSVAAVPPHLRGQKPPVQPPVVPDAPKHAPLVRQGAFKEQQDATVPPPPRPLVRQGALKQIPGVVRANAAPEGTVKALASQIEAKNPTPPQMRKGILRSGPRVSAPGGVTFKNTVEISGVNRRSRNRNVGYSSNLELSRQSIRSRRRETMSLNPEESQIYAKLSANYNNVGSMIKALRANPNVPQKSKERIAYKMELNFGEE